MVKIFALCQLLFICSNLSAQTTYEKNQTKILVDRNFLYVKINPLSLLDINLPTIQLGLETKLAPKWSIESSYGIPLKIHRKSRNTDSTFNAFYKVKLEIKHFPQKAIVVNPFVLPIRVKRILLGYYAIEVFYTRHRDSQFNYIFGDSVEHMADFAVINRSIPGFALKFGSLITSEKKKRINGDVSFGIGMRFPYLIIEPTSLGPPYDHYHEWFYKHEKEGRSIEPHLTLSLKFPIGL